MALFSTKRAIAAAIVAATALGAAGAAHAGGSHKYGPEVSFSLEIPIADAKGDASLHFVHGGHGPKYHWKLRRQYKRVERARWRLHRERRQLRRAIRRRAPYYVVRKERRDVRRARQNLRFQVRKLRRMQAWHY